MLNEMSVYNQRGPWGRL